MTNILSFIENSVPVLKSTSLTSTFAGIDYERIKPDQFSCKKWGVPHLSAGLNA